MSLLTFTLSRNPDSEGCPPYPCCSGDKLILFVDIALTANMTGVVVADIINGPTKNSETGKYDYLLQYDDSVLTDPGVPLTNCDPTKACCYNCIAEYADATNVLPSCDQVNTCVSPFTVEDGAANSEDVAPGETLTVLGTGQADTTVSATRTVTIDVPDNLIVTEEEVASTAPALSLTAGTHTLQNPLQIVITNTSPDKVMEVTLFYTFEVDIYLPADTENNVTWNFYQQIDGGGYSLLHSHILGTEPNQLGTRSKFRNYLGYFSIPASGSITIDTYQEFVVVGGSALGTVTREYTELQAKGIAV